MKPSSVRFRVVVDTNLLISSLLSDTGVPVELLKAFRENKYQILLSDRLMHELREVSERPKFAKRPIPLQIEGLVDALEYLGEFVVVAEAAIHIRDPKDAAFSEPPSVVTPTSSSAATNIFSNSRAIPASVD
jgi:putative PIN family toxin of toxin-antitoxin system